MTVRKSATYINDLPTVCDDVETLRYAGDTVIFTHGKDADVVAAKRSATLEKVTEWLNLSCLTLNTEKTVAMFFSKRRNQNVHPNIYVGGQAIKNVDEFKYLGVILDSTLTFKKHIKNMCHILKYNIANFRHIRNSLTTEAAKTYLNAMILSYIQHCISYWSQIKLY